MAPGNPYHPPATDEPSGPALEAQARPRLWPTILGLTAIYLFETQLFGLFFAAVLGGLIALPTVVIGARRRREPWKIAGLKAALVVVMMLAAVGTNLGNMALARSRAEQVVAACERFKAAEGRYPKDLEQLVPRYLSSVPSPKLMLGSQFRYWEQDGEHTLMYVKLPPFLRVLYTFESRSWSSID